jgi:hypothetical protein
LTYWIPFINKESSVLRIILSFNTGVWLVLRRHKKKIEQD